jgi:simple sugar transport system permease protein
VSRLFRSNEVLVAATIVLLSLVIGLNNPTFFSVGNLFDLLRSSVVMGIFAMGVLIVIVSGGIDVSFTAIAVFALYSTTLILKQSLPDASIGVRVCDCRGSAWAGADQRLFHRPVSSADPDRVVGTLSMFHGFLLFRSATRSSEMYRQRWRPLPVRR